MLCKYHVDPDENRSYLSTWLAVWMPCTGAPGVGSLWSAYVYVIQSPQKTL